MKSKAAKDLARIQKLSLCHIPENQCRGKFGSLRALALYAGAIKDAAEWLERGISSCPLLEKNRTTEKSTKYKLF